MYIKELELRNFKSFGKKVRLPLNNNFIAVTGPNGSGKSNIVDALLFALCLSSSRAMRAERLPDLIYKGDNGDNPDFAQVTVRLDNSTRAIPVDLDVVEISRKIKLNNDKYYTSYYFNGKSCSQGELQDQLAKAGITPEGYNVVMQGDVTRIIEMSPLDRRRIIDEIAGVSEFDEKKRRSLGELDVVRERIGRVEIILEEVGSQLQKLQGDRDKALRYQAHRDERRRQEGFLLLAQLKESEENLKDLGEEALELQRDLEDLAKSAEAKQGEIVLLEQSLKDLNVEIAHKGEDEQLEVRFQIEELKGETAREGAKLEMAQRELEEIEAQKNKCYLETDRLSLEAVNLSGMIEEATIRQASLQGEIEEQALLAQAARRKIADADAQYSQLRDQLSEAIRGREASRASMGELVRERDRFLDAARRSSLEKEEIAEEMALASKTLEETEGEEERIRSQLDSMSKKALEMERERDDLDAARLKVKREISEADRELQRLQGEYAKAEARLRATEDRSGYSRAVEAVRGAIRSKMLRGLYGTVAELGQVNPKYSVALEIAAGARLQSLVAETDEDASVAIDYLKRSQTGRATFLPLNKLEPGNIPNLPKGKGVVDYALNLVSFDRKFYSAFWYVFRDTLVVENLDVARQMMGRYRMVTLEGDLVERTGAMTGGHYKSRMKFAAEESGKLVELSERLSSAEAERGSLLDRLDAIEEHISRIDRELEELDKDIAKRTFRMEEIGQAKPRMRKGVQDKEARLTMLEAEVERTKENLARLEGEIQGAEASLAEHIKRTEELEKQLSGSDIPKLALQAEAAEAEIKRLQGRLREIDSEIVANRVREEGHRQRMAEMGQRKEALESQRFAALDRKKAAEDRIEDLKSEIERVSLRVVEIEGQINDLKGRRGQLLDQLFALQKERGQKEMDRERLESRRTATLAAEAEISERAKKLRAEIEACGLEITQTPPRVDVVYQKIKGLERAMQELEPVNMLAIQEYDHVHQRHTILQERCQTLKREREEIIEKLERYDQMKKEAFLSCFREINKNFQEIFAELSGGDGELILENGDDPLSGGMNIKARPAGKVFHRLESMSGGEKSLTALSFIFAIQKFRPAPFYAMDEIDMFLDGANVERVAKLIKKISKDAQFIVVSLRKPMVQQAKYTIGVTMQEKNISSVTGICVN